MDSKSQPNHASSLDRRPVPPPLPPRQPTQDAPPAYDSIPDPPVAMLERSWADQDPRRLSTDSLTPHESNKQGGSRKLLMIYIHGFMGNETSFRSFPAHVHNLLTVLLAETHVVHSKLYPRYRSKRNIRFARDDFSSWLEPHEGSDVDVVLLGHSMGGLVSAEVAIMPPAPPASRPLKHRILGTVNYDVPFLGMHPGVVKSGLASLFAAAPEAPTDKWSGTTLAPSESASGSDPTSPSVVHADTFWQPPNPDPNYNPAFQNDQLLPVRKGWANALHFVHKHSDSLGKATKQLVTSHMEFGGAMANYGELKARYGKIRALEEEDGRVRKSVVEYQQNVPPARVRFVNYYTACHGRPKVEKKEDEQDLPVGVGGDASLDVQSTPNASAKGSRTPSPRISLEEYRADGTLERKPPEIPSDDDDFEGYHSTADTASLNEMQHMDPDPEPERDHSPEPIPISPTDTMQTLDSRTASLSLTASLPPIPDLPPAPPPLNTSFISDKDTKKLVEKEHARSVKAYEKAAADREKMIKEREKLEKRRAEKADREAEKAKKAAQKKAKKGAESKGELTHSERELTRLADEKERMDREGRRMRGEPEPAPTRGSSMSSGYTTEDGLSRQTSLADPMTRTPSLTPSTTNASLAPSTINTSTTISKSTKPPKEEKPKKPLGPPKDRKFCSLPPKDSAGQLDPCWVRVFMKDVDEVGAHCGLFFVDERYERLVGETAERVEGWVRGM
nr:hypothetical protein B0A51_10160 [Rachicladosporium sp. CCFEE 5018]